MYLNGDEIGKGWADTGTGAGQYETFSWQSTLNLQKGDQIWLQISGKSTGEYLDGDRCTHFSGYLLEENLEVA